MKIGYPFSLKTLRSNKRYRQVASLYGSMAIGLVVGIAVSIVNTRFLGPEQFGDYKFIQTLFLFTVTFITFGVFNSGSRIIAQKKNDAIRQDITGTLLLLAGIASGIFSILVFWFSFYEDDIFDNDLSTVIRLFSPFLFIYPFNLCLEKIFQGDNRIYELSFFRIFPQLLYLGLAIVLNVIFPFSLTTALAIQFFTFGLTIIGLSVWIKPKLGGVKKNLKFIFRENRSYGFHIYLGAIAGVSTGQLGGIALGYFVDNISVGFFSLAVTLTLPLTMIPSAIGTTLFKDFANSEKISAKVLMGTLSLSLVALVLFVLIVKSAVELLYSEEYMAVVPLTYVLAIAAIFYGLGDLINRFLHAHGLGVEIRNGAILVGISNVLGFTILVKYFGTTGAIMTRLISGIIYSLMMYTYYRVYLYRRELTEQRD